MPRFLSDEDLKDSDIPAPDADLREIGRFADSFDVRHHPRSSGFIGEPGREFLARCIKDYQERHVLPDVLAELRACLLLKWAILPYITYGGPTADQEKFLRDLVRKIRQASANTDKRIT